MYLLKVTLVVAAFVLGTSAVEDIKLAVEPRGDAKKSEVSYCGVAEPDSEKTCISIRLPWQEEPVYFCTDKGKIKYKDRCGNDINRWCYGQDREHTLKIATPWDCCPITSVPDYCAGRSCPAAPYNRTCEEIQPDKNDVWDCCSTYYCDQDVKAGDCHMKRLTPGCMKAPKEKAGCIGFKDNNGCCNKYQCEGEGKPGMCPMEAQALKFKHLMENANKTSKAKTMNNAVSTTLDFHRRRFLFSRWTGSSSTIYMRCTGDHTCPGKMKCCSGDIESYHGVRHILSKTSTERAVYGYCQEPVEFDSSSDSSETGTGSPSLMIEDGSSSTETNTTA